ncbi:D-tyrosyl-tRNA(Tyr) deacylase [Candidatus Peregrinibacteria bacterium]|nr:MAG: D-tyrosyl-tRNA(Tyr) deacylase [Candidatus Peregrinibacteria bacterium]
MRALIQRTTSAAVAVNGKTIGQIGKGLVVLLGITHNDTDQDIAYLVEKIANLRVFEGEKSGFDESVLQVGGSVLVVSQFTLYGSTKKGRRPDFNDAAKPDVAEELYKKFVQKMKETGVVVETGQFQAHMQVSLVNDGPVTLMLES